MYLNFSELCKRNFRTFYSENNHSKCFLLFSLFIEGEKYFTSIKTWGHHALIPGILTRAANLVTSTPPINVQLCVLYDLFMNFNSECELMFRTRVKMVSSGSTTFGHCPWPLLRSRPGGSRGHCWGGNRGQSHY